MTFFPTQLRALKIHEIKIEFFEGARARKRFEMIRKWKFNYSLWNRVESGKLMMAEMRNVKDFRVDS